MDGRTSGGYIGVPIYGNYHLFLEGQGDFVGGFNYPDLWSYNAYMVCEYTS